MALLIRHDDAEVTVAVEIRKRVHGIVGHSERSCITNGPLWARSTEIRKIGVLDVPMFLRKAALLQDPVGCYVVEMAQGVYASNDDLLAE